MKSLDRETKARLPDHIREKYNLKPEPDGGIQYAMFRFRVWIARKLLSPALLFVDPSNSYRMIFVLGSARTLEMVTLEKALDGLEDLKNFKGQPNGIKPKKERTLH